MLAYRTPGVYLEWTEAPPVVGEPRTDVAGFVGIARRGPLHQAVRVEGWPELVATFGGHTTQGYLAYAVAGFFANGGRRCWVVRVADPDQARPGVLELLDAQEEPTLRLTARNPGSWAGRLTVRIDRGFQDRFTLTLRLPDGFSEVWPDMSMERASPRFVEVLLNGTERVAGSRLVMSEVVPPEVPLRVPDPRRPPELVEEGSDGLSSLRPEHLNRGLSALETIDEVSVVAVPDIMPRPLVEPDVKTPKPRCDVPEAEPPRPTATTFSPEPPPAFTDDQITELQAKLILHCELLGDRVALLDVPRRRAGLGVTPESARAWRLAFDSSYAAAYYPWVRVADPLSRDRLLLEVPPSGHLAGICARVDLRTGVHKPPANEVPEGVEDVVLAIDEYDHGRLNDAGVNVVRAFPGRGLRVAGARTTASDTEWRYLNVRRLLLMIRAAIDRKTRWAVFEPHNRELWREIERVVRAFLDRLWRRGMLTGATAAAAYSVRCDAATNPPEEVERGRLVCEVGVRPPWPAEFVVVRLGKTEGGVEILGERSGDG